MGIKVLNYIDESMTMESYNASNKSSEATSKAQDQDFKKALDSATKATAAIAIDALVKGSENGSVNGEMVQRFFDQHGININLNVSSGQNSSNATAAAPSSANSTNASTIANSTTNTSTSAADPNASTQATSSDNKTSGSSLGCPAELESIFDEASKKYNVDVKLLKSIAKTESNFNPKAVSKAGAMGVMQLMPATAKSFGVTNAYDARENIMAGAKLISQLLNKYNGDKSLALAAYNAGSGNVDKYGGIPPFTETQNYVKKVLNYYNS